MSSSDEISISVSSSENKEFKKSNDNSKKEYDNNLNKKEYDKNLNKKDEDTNSNKKEDDTNSNKKEDDTNSIFTVNQDLPVIINPNAVTLQSQDGRKITMFKENDEEFIKILRSLNELSDQQIRIIEVRYLNVLNEYRKRIGLYDFLYHFSRVFISLGGVAVPALLSIQSPGQVSSVALYWFTWIISLAVTIIHNISNIFRFDKKYQGIHTTIEKLHSEGWRYLQLSGRYSTHNTQLVSTHTNQYLHFVNTIEKIKNKQIEIEFNAPSEEKLKDQIKQNGNVNGTGTGATTTLSDTK